MPKRVAIIGAGPLPIYEGQSSMGPGIRTWQLAKPVARRGHEVFLVTFEFAIGSDWDFNRPRYTSPLEEVGAIEHLSLPEPLPGTYDEALQSVRERLKGFKPDAVVSAGAFFASRVAVALDPPQPLWIDLFGNTMSEIQAKVARTSSEEAEFFKFLYQSELSILRRGDRFSTLSNPQKLAAVGELSLSGRLNAQNLGYDLVDVIPCGYDGECPPVHRQRVLRGVQASEQDFVVLWTGGFNSWVDEQTLFEGLLRAMHEDRTIRWVGLGGGIKGHFQKGYENFRRQAEDSPFKNRFLFLDWIPTDRVQDYFFESNLGINVDLPIYETLLGGRNRMVGWMAAGLPVLTTEMSEISRIVAQEGLGFTVPPQRPDLLATKLVELAHRPQQLRAAGERALEYARKQLTFEATVQPLLRWLEQPILAPDRKFLKNQGVAHLNSLDAALDGFVHYLGQTPSEEPERGFWEKWKRKIRGWKTGS